MGRRLVRIPSERLAGHLGELMGQSLHVVLRDGRTYFGTMKRATHDTFELRDRRFYRHRFMVADVQELVLDR